MLFIVVMMAVLANGTVAGAMSGGQPAAYLDYPQGARALSLGGAVTSLSGDPLFCAANPAVIAGITGNTLDTAFSARGLDRTQAQLAFVMSTMNNLHLGLLVNYFSVVNIPGTDIYGNATGTFDDREATFLVGLAYQYSRCMRWGLAARYYSQSLADNSAHGLGFDAGLQTRYPIGVNSFLRFGASITNLGASLSWDTENGTDEDITPSYRFGLAFENTSIWPCLIAYDVRLQFHEGLIGGDYESKRTSHACGLEIWPNAVVALRCGYISDDSPEIDTFDIENFTFGAGAVVRAVRVDYTYRVDRVSHIGTSTLGLRFGF